MNSLFDEDGYKIKEKPIGKFDTAKRRKIVHVFWNWVERTFDPNGRWSWIKASQIQSCHDKLCFALGSLPPSYPLPRRINLTDEGFVFKNVWPMCAKCFLICRDGLCFRCFPYTKLMDLSHLVVPQYKTR